MRQISYIAEATRLAQELIRVPSLSGEEEGVASCVEAEMRLWGYDCVERDELGNVVGVVCGRREGRCVIFDAHMDTVPVADPAAWRHPPFAAQREEGRLWGRGAADVKGSLAALVVAVGSLAGKLDCGRVIVAATVGEERIEGLGLGHVLARRPADGVVVCEPTGLRVGIGHKGRMGIVVSAKGRAAHSSQPEQGLNAVYRLMEAIAAIRTLPAQEDDLLGHGVNELVEIISSPYPGTSMVPSGCRARFDRRLVRGETLESVLQEMRQAVAPFEGVSVEVHRGHLTTYTGCVFDVDDYQPAWAQAKDGELVRVAQRALRAIGQEAALFVAPYCTDGSVAAEHLGLPTILYGAGEVSEAHIVDESISLEELGAAFEGYRALALALTAA
ncbi:MAG: YgeY family selenium metabolism-linked hydrolase [Chloroflexi bacterium]|nr:YgeY family selenium metabolism-linked hydrolase [Chloroflexota bacterium]